MVFFHYSCSSLLLFTLAPQSTQPCHVEFFFMLNPCQDLSFLFCVQSPSPPVLSSLREVFPPSPVFFPICRARRSCFFFLPGPLPFPCGSHPLVCLKKIRPTVQWRKCGSPPFPSPPHRHALVWTPPTILASFCPLARFHLFTFDKLFFPTVTQFPFRDGSASDSGASRRCVPFLFWSSLLWPFAAITLGLPDSSPPAVDPSLRISIPSDSRWLSWCPNSQRRTLSLSRRMKFPITLTSCCHDEELWYCLRFFAPFLAGSFFIPCVPSMNLEPLLF